jgi:carbamoyl-phosphate synthase large subunit
MPNEKLTVLIAGIGGGSLGLELFKSLRDTGRYRLIGTDISERAYGFSERGFDQTYLLSRTDSREYAARLLEIGLQEKVEAIAPGAEEVHKILSGQREMFQAAGILLMLNSEEVIDLCADKLRSLQFLADHGLPAPAHKEIEADEDIETFQAFPCVVKPARASGGSNLVFIAEDEAEALFFVNYIRRRGYHPFLQEYIESTDEYTVGVLSSPSGEILGSIALRRFLDTKLSYNLRYDNRVISSGWSQGEIDDFEGVRRQAEAIARTLESRWALNIQGRLDHNGVFYPFEINPRHSGTTYLRALAGFNEPDILLQYSLKGCSPPPLSLKKGYYVRSLAEAYLPKGASGRRD